MVRTFGRNGLQRGCWIVIFAIAFWAMLYPFYQTDPLQQAAALAHWQMPTKLAALEPADQKKLLSRLTYPYDMPALAEVPDFDAIKDTVSRKKAFFAYLLPFIKRENARLMQIRSHILDVYAKQQAGARLTVEEYAFIYSLFDEFKIDNMEADLAGFQELLARVDVIPVSLVLTQAAKESGWGSSRFAIEAYNFFGQWCFKSGCGVVPSKRSAGKYHEVAVFPHVAASITAYFYNLNTFYVYDDLRALRQQIRGKSNQIDAVELVPGLIRYSERGADYVNEITGMVQSTEKLLGQSS